jgi:hypothetical protein
LNGFGKVGTMLRKTVALLIALNLIWWIWAKGWLALVGLPAPSAGNPEYLARQIHPEALRVQPLPPGSLIVQSVPATNGSAASDTESDAGAGGKRHSRRR